MFKNRLHKECHFLRYYVERSIRSSSLSPITGCHNRDILSFVFTIDTSLDSALKYVLFYPISNLSRTGLQ